MIADTFSARLEEMRRAADVSQAELARRLGLSRSTVCLLLQGKHQPGSSTLLALHDLSGAPLAWLARGSPPVPSMSETARLIRREQPLP